MASANTKLHRYFAILPLQLLAEISWPSAPTVEQPRSMKPTYPTTLPLSTWPRVSHEHMKNTESPMALILFAVQDPEVHALDQRWLEYYLLEKHGIQIVRMTLPEFHLTARLDDDRRLMVPTLTSDLHTHEISVVYFRAGYGPSNYLSDKEWQARRLLELSPAIKYLTIITQLAGCKKVQRTLATPGAVERYDRLSTMTDLDFSTPTTPRNSVGRLCTCIHWTEARRV